MPSRNRPSQQQPAERDYDVSHFEGHNHGHEHSELADVGGGVLGNSAANEALAGAPPAHPTSFFDLLHGDHAGHDHAGHDHTGHAHHGQPNHQCGPGCWGAGGAATEPAQEGGLPGVEAHGAPTNYVPLPGDPPQQKTMLELLHEEAGTSDLVCELPDAALQATIDSALETGWFNPVTDGEATAALGVLKGASLEQQHALITSLRSSGKMDVLIDNLPADQLEGLDGPLAALLASDRIADSMGDWVVTDSEAGGALDVITALPAEQQAAALAELDDETFSTFLKQLPHDRIPDLQAAYDATLDPARKVQLWGQLHRHEASRLEEANHDDSVGWFSGSDVGRHRNARVAQTASSTRDEVDDEVANLLQRIADGEDITAGDVTALAERKKLEMDLEVAYGINLTNDTGEEDRGYDNERRVWTMSELAEIDGALSRMPESHVRDNEDLLEIRRQDIARRKNDDGDWEEKPTTGASAGSGMVRFFDRGTDYDAATGSNGVGDPWRTAKESELSGHDPSATGSEGATHLIAEILSHELGHTVHQGNDELWGEFLEISDWQFHDKDSLEAALEASGQTDDAVEAILAFLDETRDRGFSARNRTVQDGDLLLVNPYNDEGYLSVDALAVDDAKLEWRYAQSNPADHFAEIYTKAVHAPEELYEDLVSAPEAGVTAAQAQRDLDEAAYNDAVDKGLPDSAVAALREVYLESEAAVTSAEDLANLRAQQHEFFRSEVFGVDDSAIQALVAPPGKEAVYAEYQEKAAMCMTPLQLEALEKRYEGRL